MHVSKTQFLGQEKMETCRMMHKKKPDFYYCKEKVEIPKEAEDLILKLLEKNLKYRILSNEIAYHNWFKDINFRDILLQNLKCPYIGIYFSRK